MTQGSVPVERRPPPEVADITVEAPPGLPPAGSAGLLQRLLPVVLSAAGMGVMAAAVLSGSAVSRNPMFLAFPAIMLASMVATVLAGRGRRRGGDIDTDRTDYLGYLSRLHETVAKVAGAQHGSLTRSHPEPDTLWTLIGGPRMWERRAGDPDFGLVRVGVGTVPLAARLVPPDTAPQQPSDPVTATALRRFLLRHSAIIAPIAIGVRDVATVTIDGDVTAVRGLLRALLGQLAVLHPPDDLLIAGVISDRHRAQWDWLKWLPHNQDPAAVDEVGAARMVYGSLAEARPALAAAGVPHTVVVVDLDCPEPIETEVIPGVTILLVGTGRNGAPLSIALAGTAQALPYPDQLDLIDALTCARRLARYRAMHAGSERDGGPGWASVVGVDDVTRFDPIAMWRNHRDRLRVPIGTTADGAPLELDIKEPAEHGMGPHGLCVGATGSGKSELLRTIALGMMARNSPEVLNLLLIDFKGGATFLDLARAPHVAAVITNLSDEAPLVARMRDALGGEMQRRQRLLRTAGCAGVAAYERARRAGARMTALPTLFIIVDEFSEMLSQQPDFGDTFVAIGRLGRSLGMHLLLASQRLEEGRLRGLEAHLSYRICLKTLSAGESRAVLGTLDAYELPTTPGAGFLRAGGGELIRFQADFVSGPLPPAGPAAVAAVATPSVRLFSSRAAGPVSRAQTGGSAVGTVAQAVLDRLSKHGPPAHRVWLPPLGAAPALDTLPQGGPEPGHLTVPIGLIDRPFEQCRTPLIVELSGAAGNVAVVGAPQSGKSTALRTLITALAAMHDPRQVQFYCLDFGGGALTALRAWPHVGAVASRAEPRLVARMIAECESVVRTREATFGDHGIDSMARYRQMRAEGHAAASDDPFGDVFLVVDGWARLRHEFEALEASVTALAAQGLSFGVHVVLAASRWAEIRPALKDQIGSRIELRLGDPADSEFDRRRAQQVPRDKPGRGLSRDGLHTVIALPIDRVPVADSIAPPVPLLPTLVDHDAVVRGADAESTPRVLLGLEERRLRPVAIDFERRSHLLVLGDNECGKSATLRTLCREIVRTRTAAEARLLVVDYRRSLLGVVEPEHLGGYAMSPPALGELLPGLLDLLRRRMPPADAGPAQLRARSWWSGPDIYLVVDDYDLVAVPAGSPLAVLVEYLAYATDLGLHLIVARRCGGWERAMFEPVLAALRDLGCMTLTMSGQPDEGAPFGSVRPARMPPGRGVLITRAGDEQLVQVAWTPP